MATVGPAGIQAGGSTLPGVFSSQKEAWGSVTCVQLVALTHGHSVEELSPAVREEIYGASMNLFHLHQSNMATHQLCGSSRTTPPGLTFLL